MDVSPSSDWNDPVTDDSEYAVEAEEAWPESAAFGEGDDQPDTTSPSPTDLVAAGVVAHGVVHVIRRAWEWLRGRPATEPESVSGWEEPEPSVISVRSTRVEAEPHELSTADEIQSSPAGSRATAHEPESSDGEQLLARERAMLIDGLVDLDETWGDRFQSLRDKVRRTLLHVGIDAVLPATGQPFDAAEHESVGAEPTTEEHLDETIASVEAAGYVDRGTVVRQPQVIVYRKDRS